MKYIIYLILLFTCFETTGATYYCNPTGGLIANDGSVDNPWPSLEEVIAAGYIESYEYSIKPYDPNNNALVVKNLGAPIMGGDTIILQEGLHGEIFLRAYNNDIPITIIGENGQQAILKSLQIQGGKNWKFVGLDISSEPYGDYINNRLVYFESHGFHGPCSNIDIIDCQVYSSLDPWATADGWLDNVSTGIYMQGDHMQAINNEVTNVDHGIMAVGDSILVQDNEVVNFSGDGGRILGSYITFEGNLIKNCYDVDDNHDDGIQSYTTNGIVVDNNNVIGNTIINTDDVNRPLNGPLQGLACFDGIYNNWYVANNLIYVNHWHGITFLGANNCTIVNNTVIDPTPDITPGASWIRIDDDKDGTPSTNCIVKNNVANQLVVDAEVSNNIILDTYDSYEANFVDYINFDFHLTANSILIDAADHGASPELDIEGYDRFIGGGPDVGAYEYRLPLSTSETESIERFVYPNPCTSFIYLMNGSTAGLYAIDGSLIMVLEEGNNAVSHIPSGAYFVRVNDQKGDVLSTEIIIKK